MDLSVQSLATLDWPYVVAALARGARTPGGRRLAEAADLMSDPSQIGDAFDAVDEVLELRREEGLGLPLGGIEDIDDSLLAAARGEVLELEPLVEAAHAVAGLEALGRFVDGRGESLVRLGEEARAIDLDGRFVATLAGAFDERGQLSESAWPELAELRRRIAALERRIRTTVQGLLESAEFADLLQDHYVTQREGRFVLPIKAQAKNLGLGIVHDSSRTHQTVFVEPAAIVPMGNQWRMAEADLRAEELRIRAELSGLLGRHAGSVTRALEAAARLDLASARAALALRLGAVRPQVGRDGVLELRAARHPVLALADARVVANDLRLDGERPVLVLTGPNAGGKTVAMKTVGLCALLVRAGCFVPAEDGARVDVFDPVVADIGDAQTVHEGLSSFSGHLATVHSMLEVAAPGALVLLDEIASGTDPSQGGALARALVERFADAGARVVVTTHYAALKAMPAADSRVEVSAMEYRDGRPTYRVLAGMAGESHALEAAERAGLDRALVERARDLMGDAERTLHEALAALEAERERADEAARTAERRARELAAREAELARREARIKGRARELEAEEAAAFLARLRAAEAEVREAMKALHAAPTGRSAEETRALLRRARGAAEPDGIEAAAATPSARMPAVGDRVRVLGLGAVGDVVAVRGQELEVRAGAMLVRVGPTEVEFVSRAAASAAQSSRGSGGGRRSGGTRHGVGDGRRSASATGGGAGDGPAVARDPLTDALRTPGNTLDLRGQRVEEGLALVEDFLDRSVLAGREVVFILHGHGTGAMKEAVRRELASSAYVARAAPAAEEQGGDALTAVLLR